RGLQPEDSTGSVVSNLMGAFQLKAGTMSFPKLSFEVPGGAVILHGRYGLRSENLDFRGELRLQAKVSQTTHGIRSLLLNTFDPLFHKHGAGTWVPLKIQGTRSDPKFGVEF